MDVKATSKNLILIMILSMMFTVFEFSIDNQEMEIQNKKGQPSQPANSPVWPERAWSGN